MNKKILILLIVVFVAIGGWFGYTKYNEAQQAKERAAAQERIAQQRAAQAAEEERLRYEEQQTPQQAEGEEPVEQAPQPISQPETEFTPVRDNVPAPSAVQQTAEQALAASGDEPIKISQLLEDKVKIAFNISMKADPTISIDDRDTVERNRLARIRAEEAAKRAQLDAERRAADALRRKQDEEKLRKRYPTREVEGKITLQGIVNQEVFINGRTYTVGSVVEGARITHINESDVTFSYKGHTFKKSIRVN